MSGDESEVTVEVYVKNLETGERILAGQLEEQENSRRRILSSTSASTFGDNILKVTTDPSENEIVVLAVGLADGSSFEVESWAEEDSGWFLIFMIVMGGVLVLCITAICIGAIITIKFGFKTK